MSDRIFETGQDDFDQKVIDASFERTVVVDFWAEWCGPCLSLGPILEEVVTSLGERVSLAKVNVDQDPELSASYQVRGIPAVKIFRDGEIVGEFVGALPRSEVESILESFVPDENDDLVKQADTLVKQGDLDGATAIYERVLTNRPGDERVLLSLARTRLDEGELGSVREFAGRIQEGGPYFDRAKALLAQVQFIESCRATGGLEACKNRVAANSDDLRARFDLGVCCAAEEDYAAALQEWLGIVEKKKDFMDGAVKDAMVSVFNLLSQNHELVRDYQKRLYRALY